jgi:hypothetical protein
MKKLEQMEYICDKIIHIVEFEKLHIYFKTRILSGIITRILLWCMILICIN